ncbi:MAG: hypothetical protein LBD14_00635 [Puniceicoccales bacterium]|jgi:hypothetical protein|nr:hypothetical protein [Puniceicoccales bacterium]
MLLLGHGIDGMRVASEEEGAPPNFVVFDENAVEIQNRVDFAEEAQGSRGDRLSESDKAARARMLSERGTERINVVRSPDRVPSLNQKEAIAFAKNEFSGRGFENADTGKSFFIMPGGIDKMIGQGNKGFTRERIAAVYRLPQLIKNAKGVSMPDGGGSPRVATAYHLYVPFEWRGTVYRVRLLAREFNDSSLPDVHSYRIEDIVVEGDEAGISGEPQVGSHTEAGGERYDPPASSAMAVSELFNADKPKINFAEEANTPPVSGSGVVYRGADGSVTPVEMHHGEGFSVVELPEMVSLARELGVALGVGKMKKGTRGVFKPVGDGQILIGLDVFENPAQAAATLAHEIGHAIDWFGKPGSEGHKTMSRGNLLGRLAVLRNFRGTVLPRLPADMNRRAMSEEEREALLMEATRRTNSALGVSGMPAVAEDPAAWSAWQATRAREYAQLVDREMSSGALEKLATVRDELKALSAWWRPWNEAAAGDKFRAYRNSSPELYADAISVLFNSPGELQLRAPVFWEMFLNHASRKPDVLKAISDIQNRYFSGRSGVMEARSEGLRKGFEAGRDAFLGHWHRRRQSEGLREQLGRFLGQQWNRYHPITSRAARVPDVKVRAQLDFFFDEHPLGDSKVALWLHDMDREVMKPLIEKGLTMTDLSEYLFYARVAGDQTGVARSGGHTPASAAEGMASLVERLEQGGAGRGAALEAAAVRARDLFDAVVERGVESGLFSAAKVAQWQAENGAYAPFAALSHFREDGRISAGFAAVKGNLGDIIEPGEALILKAVAIMRRAQLNDAKRTAVDFLREWFPSEATPVKLSFGEGGEVLPMRKPADPRRTGAVMVYRKGAPEGYYVPAEVSGMFDRLSPAQANVVMEWSRAIFTNVFYPAFVGYNPGFLLATGPVRDMGRAGLNVPTFKGKMRVVGDMIWRIANVIPKVPMSDSARIAKSLVAGDFSDPMVRWALETGAVPMPHELFTARGLAGLRAAAAGRDPVLQKLMEQYRLLPPGERDGWWSTKIAPTLVGRAIGATLGWVRRNGQEMEAVAKISPWLYTKNKLGWGERDAAYFARNYVGVPNTSRSGSLMQFTKGLIPFIDVFARGIGADLGERAAGFSPLYGRKLKGLSGDRVEFRYKSMRERAKAAAGMGGHILRYLSSYIMGMGGLLLMQKSAEEGAFGPDIQRAYDLVPGHDKKSSFVFPFRTVGTPGVDEKAMYFRIPIDETTALINSLVRGSIDVSQGKDVSDAGREVFAFGRGNLPGWNPVLKIGGAWMEYMSGRNPGDDFRGGNVISRSAQDARPVAGGYAFREMLTWSADQTGYPSLVPGLRLSGGNVDWSIEKTPVVGRLVKVSGRGMAEKQEREQGIIDAQSARVRAEFRGTIVERALRERGLIQSLDGVRVRNVDQKKRLYWLNTWNSVRWEPARDAMIRAYEAGDPNEANRIKESLIEGSEWLYRDR